MIATSSADLVRALRQYRQLTSEQLAQLATLAARYQQPEDLGRDLEQRGWLTTWQVKRLLQGRGQELVLGSYTLLEPLGQGGMGTVYKARHATLDRLVALKVIHRERVQDSRALRRFQREIQLVSALDHANVVRAFDADVADGVPFLVMEFVAGIDLAQVVKSSGPLSIRAACDAIRQAALGLQHAHERGLVHRDIKPSNLLRTNRGNVVKVLDLGLARLQEDHEEGGRLQSPGSGLTALTQMNRLMGTPDYLAPEQAIDPSKVDHRADLYSLGCTFYFLLTGEVPFPGGSGMEKAIRHQAELPRSVQELRPEVPAAVAAVVEQLLAKRPEQRLPSAAAVAAALDLGGAETLPQRGAAARRTEVASPANLRMPLAGQTLPAWLTRRLLGMVVGALLCFAGITAAAWYLLPAKHSPATAPAEERVEVAPPTAEPADPRQPVFLSELLETGLAEHCRFGKNGEFPGGGRLLVGGVEVNKGLALVPAQKDALLHVTYPLEGRYELFKGKVGVNDTAPATGKLRPTLQFQVLGDGKLLWQSRNLRTRGDSQPFSVPVKRVQQLTLQVKWSGPLEYSHAVWLDPQLLPPAGP